MNECCKGRGASVVSSSKACSVLSKSKSDSLSLCSQITSGLVMRENKIVFGTRSVHECTVLTFK